MDAQAISNYFQALGGVPASNILLLQDWRATRSDIDEALLDWLPPRMNNDAVVIVYFAGLVSVGPTGETFLVPYDGTATTASRSYPVKDLEAALSRLHARHTVFLFDGIVSPMEPDKRTKTALSTLPQWNPPGSSTLHVIGISGIGQGLEDDQHQHGLFTYYLLRALRGEADTQPRWRRDARRNGDLSQPESALGFQGPHEPGATSVCCSSNQPDRSFCCVDINQTSCHPEPRISLTNRMLKKLASGVLASFRPST